MIKFIIGLFIGGLLGFCAACILQAEEVDDNDE